MVLGLVGVLGGLAVACGGGSGDSAIEVRAEDYRFVPATIRIVAGEEVTLRLRNTANQVHDLEVQGLTVEGADDHSAGGHESAAPGTLALHAERGETVSIAFTLTPDQRGTYEFWCTISGHKELGMVGTLIVN